MTSRLCFLSSRRRHTTFDCDWSSDVCSSDLGVNSGQVGAASTPVGVLRSGCSIPSKDANSQVSPRRTPFSVSGSFSRSEEHTSELQSQSNLVCRLLLEKKNRALVTSATDYVDT